MHEPVLNKIFAGGQIKHASLFTGIGGFDLAAKWRGYENVFQCEINEWCQKLLKQNFPECELYDNIKTFNATKYEGQITILTGGFPCQPFSVAGKRKGTEDERYLWFEMLRIIREVKPKIVIGENVPGIIGLALGEVLTSLENEGYTTQPFIIPACAVNAPHKRDRIWIVAYSNEIGCQNEQKGHEQTDTDEKRHLETKEQSGFTEQRGFGEYGNNVSQEFATNTESSGQQGSINGQREKQLWGSYTGIIQFKTGWDFTKPGVCGRNDGVSDRVDRIEALGNAIVPQVAYEIFGLVENLIAGYGKKGEGKNFIQNHLTANV